MNEVTQTTPEGFAKPVDEAAIKASVEAAKEGDVKFVQEDDSADAAVTLH